MQPHSIREACIAAHEYYVSLRDAGFTVQEALYLVAATLTGGPPRPPADPT
jgi:hypothetical protein